MRRTGILLWCALLSQAVAAPAAAQPVQPVCLDTLGVRQLLLAHPELTGADVTLALVELSQPLADGADGYAFLPNFEHHSLQAVQRAGLYYYPNPHRPVRYSQHATTITGILFGSDLPVARMRMRRVCEDGVYVNVIPRGLYGDVTGDVHMREVDPPEADELSFFMYEIIDAFRRAAEATGLTRGDIEDVFRNNAQRLLAT